MLASGMNKTVLIFGLLGATALMACSPSQTSGKTTKTVTTTTTTGTMTEATPAAQPAPSVSPVTDAPFQTIDVKGLREMMQTSTVYLVDVRTPEEFAEGHVEGAINIPLDQIEARLSELPKDKSVHVICRSGRRSAQAAEILVKNGFAGVVNVDGGMNAWNAAAYPTVK